MNEAASKKTPARKKATKKKATKKKPAKKKAAKKKAAKKKAAKKKPAKKKPAKKKPAKKKAAKKKPAKKKAAKKKPAKKKPHSARSIAKLLASRDPVGQIESWVGDVRARSEPLARLEAEGLLGSAQLLLGRLMQSDRGGGGANAVADAVLSIWELLPDRQGFHATEVVRNALGAVTDPGRIDALERVAPTPASAELLFNLACARAVSKDRRKLLAALERALAAGVGTRQVRADADFRPFLRDPDFEDLLAAAWPSSVPWDVAPHVEPLRRAVDGLVAAMKDVEDRKCELGSPASRTRIGEAEHRSGYPFPNEYRAMLTLHDGLEVFWYELLGTKDWLGETSLYRRAKDFVEMSVRYGATGLDECIPIANCGSPNSWLIYDPTGRFNEEETAGFFLLMTADQLPFDSLAEAVDDWTETVTDLESQ